MLNLHPLLSSCLGGGLFVYRLKQEYMDSLEAVPEDSASLSEVTALRANGCKVKRKMHVTEKRQGSSQPFI